MKAPDSRLNLVLGCATGYSSEQIAPFAATLRRSGFSGEVVLIVYEHQVESLRPLADKYRIELVPIRDHQQGPGSRLQNRGRMQMVHRAIAISMPGVCGSTGALYHLSRCLPPFYHIACARYFLYYRWLYRRPGRYSRVLLSDVRDVIFQADPFRYAAQDGLYYFMDPTVNLGDEPVNSEWMTVTYGEEYEAARRGRRLACSGTTLGDQASMLKYLREMCLELIRNLARVVGLLGVDQAVHNYLLWEGLLPGVILCENGENAVMTLKNASATTFVFDTERRLLNRDGLPAPVLHQYDFHAAFDAKP